MAEAAVAGAAPGRVAILNDPKWRSIIFQTGTMYLLLLVPLILFGRYVSRPLKALTEGARKFEKSGHSPVAPSRIAGGASTGRSRPKRAITLPSTELTHAMNDHDRSERTWAVRLG